MTLPPEALQGFRARYPEVKLDIIEARFPLLEASLRVAIVDLFVGPLPADVGREAPRQTRATHDNGRRTHG